MNHDIQQTWEHYVSSWKAATPEAARAAFARSLDPRCVYTDPLTQARGWDELAAAMQQFHAQVPGGHFVTTYFLAHHGKSIARWNMVGGDGAILGDGISYGEYSDAGMLVAMTGFFETGA